MHDAPSAALCKKEADTGSLLAVIMAHAMNHGLVVMSRTRDVPWHVLNTTSEQYLRKATLEAASDRISDAISLLPVFPQYSFDPAVLYGAVDGQKFSVRRPTISARHSRKYFGRGRGVVAYSLLCNHIPLSSSLIGAHDYEGHHVFDIWYRNTAAIVPEVVTGDMHSINRTNFAILYCFGGRFELRFTRISAQMKEVTVPVILQPMKNA